MARPVLLGGRISGGAPRIRLDCRYTGTNTDRATGAFLIRSRVREVFVVRRGTVESFDQPGLFKVLLDEPSATPTAEEVAAVFPHPRRVRARPESRRRHAAKSMLHRYCSGCSREAEHVPWGAGGPTSTASIHWPAAEPASGTTICLDCGQLRAPASRPSPSDWSSWTRKPGDARGAAAPTRRSVSARGRRLEPVAVSLSGGREQR